jgi:hypothetical protein
MEYIYHKVPDQKNVETLYPLFQIKDLLPKIYEKAIKKYDDHESRKQLPYKIIPKLNCRRGDVIHCSSINPSIVYKAYKQVFPRANYFLLFYKIPIVDLAHLPLVLFDMNREGYVFGMDNDPESSFDLIDSKRYEEIRVVPEEAIDFYKQWKKQGKSGAPIWGKIPHVFVQGAIPVSDYEVIDWRSSG